MESQTVKISIMICFKTWIVLLSNDNKVKNLEEHRLDEVNFSNIHCNKLFLEYPAASYVCGYLFENLRKQIFECSNCQSILLSEAHNV